MARASEAVSVVNALLLEQDLELELDLYGNSRPSVSLNMGDGSQVRALHCIALRDRVWNNRLPH
jgi:hypothetical protein